jgi:high affinity Mn2+ porin
MSRAYLRQTFGLGGDPVQKKSDAMQLGGAVDSRRLVFTVGKFSVLDFIDKNSLAGDLRRQFMNMTFLTNAAYDFAADARGYTWGGLAELYFDAWAVRLMRVAGPQDPNQLPIDYRLWEHYGDQLEVEHGHKILGQSGVVRVLGYRNREDMGRFADAIAAFEADPQKNGANCPKASFSYRAIAAVTPTAAQTAAAAHAPDLCWVRGDNVKMGLGINLEQQLSDDLGVFLRGMYSDGQTEVYSFTSTDRSLSFGALSRGSLWHRAADSAGAAFGLGWISSVHAAYLNMGGIDGFIGDGKINQAAESVLELFYSLNVTPSLWLTADYQHITNPAYNADRGPVEIFGGRLHSEF